MKTFTIESAETKTAVAQLFTEKNEKTIPLIAAWVEDMSMGNIPADDYRQFLQTSDVCPFQTDEYYLECRMTAHYPVREYSLYKREQSLSVVELDCNAAEFYWY